MSDAQAGQYQPWDRVIASRDFGPVRRGDRGTVQGGFYGHDSLGSPIIAVSWGNGLVTHVAESFLWPARQEGGEGHG